MATTGKNLEWIVTDGGPTVVLQTTNAGEWQGVADDQDREGDVTTWGDYGKACTIDDRLGIVEYGTVGDQYQALVLGDEPLMSTYLPEHQIVLRWWCANSEDHMLAMVDAELPRARWESPIHFPIPPGGLVMIDATCALSDYGVGGWVDGEPIQIDLLPGPYRVESARVSNLSESAVAIIHRFTTDA